ncbi:MAG: hypothetical protein RLZZ403_239 [Pseudomonadota bacterium]|jgi:hypothetical protein
MEASSHFLVAALNMLAFVMLVDSRDRGWLRFFGIVINGGFALVNAAYGFQKVLA